MNRGSHVLNELVEASRRHGITDLVVVYVGRGEGEEKAVKEEEGSTKGSRQRNLGTERRIGGQNRGEEGKRGLRRKKEVLREGTVEIRPGEVDRKKRDGREGEALSKFFFRHETRGRPDALTISHLPSGPTAYFSLTNVVTRHDIHGGLDNMSTTAPHLIFNNFNSKLGNRVVNILKHLFPPPKEESQRCVAPFSFPFLFPFSESVLPFFVLFSRFKFIVFKLTRV
jgi:rRNA maturation protein Rpf1